jgi:RNA polymerase sigma-70 factor (ECF subfamily)
VLQPVMSPQPDLTDELPARLARDLDGSFAELVGAYQRLVFGLALRVVADRADAEEVAQDTFARAYWALASYPSERVAAMRLRPWLAQITLNLARNRRRRRPPPARPLEDGDGQALAVAAPAAAEPAAVAERGQDRELLVELLAALPRGWREAVVLRHVEGLPYDEVAEVLGRPVGTVKTHVHRGVRRLRDHLEAREERVPR